MGISPEDKLGVLRSLDRFRPWQSLSDRRQCLACGQIILGSEIEVVGGTRGLGPLRLRCPTENCTGVPMDWVLPRDAVTLLFVEHLPDVPVPDSGEI